MTYLLILLFLMENINSTHIPEHRRDAEPDHLRSSLAGLPPAWPCALRGGPPHPIGICQSTCSARAHTHQITPTASSWRPVAKGRGRGAGRGTSSSRREGRYAPTSAATSPGSSGACGVRQSCTVPRSTNDCTGRRADTSDTALRPPQPPPPLLLMRHRHRRRLHQGRQWWGCSLPLPYPHRPARGSCAVRAGSPSPLRRSQTRS